MIIIKKDVKKAPKSSVIERLEKECVRLGTFKGFWKQTGDDGKVFQWYSSFANNTMLAILSYLVYDFNDVFVNYRDGKFTLEGDIEGFVEYLESVLTVEF